MRRATTTGWEASAEPVDVLHVDDDPDLLGLSSAYLEHEFERFEVSTETSAREALASLPGDLDCIVSDYEMPGVDGLEFLERVREKRPDLPFILYTGKGSEDIASEAIKRGVTDYLQKGGPDTLELLANRIENAVQRYWSERRVAERTREFETLVDNLPGIVFQCLAEEDWPMRKVRGECERLCGYDADALTSDEVVWGRDVIHPDDQPRVGEQLRPAIDSGEPFEMTYRIVTRDGDTRQVWERARGVYDDDGTLEAIEGFITDLVDRREWGEVESEARESESHASGEASGYGEFPTDLDFVFDRVTDVLYGLDTEWRVTYLNEGARQVLSTDVGEGLTKGEIVGEVLWELDPHLEELELYETCHEAMERQEMVSHTTRHEDHHKDHDETFWAYTRAFPSESGVTVISRDVTERVENERELQRQNERLEEFASIVSHDLRNPLNVAQGHLQLARETGDLEHLDTVSKAHGRMSGLVDDLLALAREGAEIDELESVDLAAFARECWRHVETPRGSLDVDVDRTIRGDSSRLAQLFENLFRNAVEHGSTGSQPSEAAGDAVEHGDADVTVRVTASEGGFAIEDDGPGIPPEERDRVFRAGYSTSEDGIGFGLRIVKEIADAHGWDVAVTESEAGGARFEFAGVEMDETAGVEMDEK